jgi:hypothetical protein
MDLNMGRGKFLYFSHSPPPEKIELIFIHFSGKTELFFYIFLAVIRNSTSLHQVIDVILVRTIWLLDGQGSKPLLPVGWRNVQILRRHI